MAKILKETGLITKEQAKKLLEMPLETNIIITDVPLKSTVAGRLQTIMDLMYYEECSICGKSHDTNYEYDDCEE